MQVRNTPNLDARYWAAISLASVFGANMGDFVSHILGLGHWLGLGPLAVLFAIILLIEHRLKFGTEAFYWLAIVTMRTAATNIADLADHDLRLQPEAVIMVLAGALAVVLLSEPRSEPSEAGPTVSARLPATDARYWTAMLIAGVLGTALGDYAADNLGLGLGRAAEVTTTLLVAMLALRNLDAFQAKSFYWFTIVLVRTAGTNVGDFLASKRGLQLGLVVSTPCTGLLLLSTLVLWQTGTTMQLSMLKNRLFKSPNVETEAIAPTQDRVDTRVALAVFPLAICFVGWILFILTLAYSTSREDWQHGNLIALEMQNQKLGDELKQQASAVGSLSDVEIRRDAAEAATAIAQKAAANAIKALQEAEAHAVLDRDAALRAAATDAVKPLRDAEAKAIHDRDAALREAVDAKGEQAIVLAQVNAFHQTIHNLEEQIAPLTDQVAALNSRRVYLEKQTGDLETLLSGLASARDTAITTVDDARAEHDRLMLKASDLRHQNDASQMQLDQAQQDLSAKAAERTDLERQVQKLRTEVVDRAGLVKHLNEIGKQLKQVVDETNQNAPSLNVAIGKDALPVDQATSGVGSSPGPQSKEPPVFSAQGATP